MTSPDNPQTGTKRISAKPYSGPRTRRVAQSEQATQSRPVSTTHYLAYPSPQYNAQPFQQATAQLPGEAAGAGVPQYYVPDGHQRYQLATSRSVVGIITTWVVIILQSLVIGLSVYLLLGGYQGGYGNPVDYVPGSGQPEVGTTDASTPDVLEAKLKVDTGVVAPGQDFHFSVADSTYPSQQRVIVTLDFGDGTKSTVVNTHMHSDGTYSYDKPGRYTMVLNMTDAQGHRSQARKAMLVTNDTGKLPIPTVDV